MKKRILSLLTSCALVLGLLPSAAFAAGAVPTISAECGDPVLVGTEVVKVDMVLDTTDTSGIAAFTVKIDYDDSVMQPGRDMDGDGVIDAKSYFDDNKMFIVDLNTESKPMSLSGMSLENITENGAIGSLYFTLNKDCQPGNYPIKLTAVEATDGNTNTKMDFAVVDGTISVTLEPYPDADNVQFETPTEPPVYNGQNQMPELKGVPAEATVMYTVNDGEPTATPEAVAAGEYTINATVEIPGYAEIVRETTLTIAEATLHVEGMTANDKPYDGNNKATINSESAELTGILGDDVVTATFPTTGTFASTDVDEGIVVTPDDIVLGGADAGNYKVEKPALTANITEPEVKSIEITTLPANTDQYIEGQKIEYDGMVVTATYNNNATAPIDGWKATSATTDLNDLTPGKHTVVIDFCGYTDEFTITVAPKELVEIQIEGAETAKFYIDEKLPEIKVSSKKITVKAIFNNGQPGVDVTEYCTFTAPVEPLVEGVNHVIISYTYKDGQSDTAELDVTAVKKTTGGGGGGGGFVKSYTITVTQGENGKITDAEGKVIDKVKVEGGDDATFTITPDKGYVIENVKVNGKDMGAIKTYTFKEVEEDGTISATFAKAKTTFIDVKPGDWFYNAVYTMCDKGLMSGMSANTFEPNTNLSRGMIAQILYSLEGKPEVKGNAFSDVAANQWYAAAVNWAYQNEIVSGYGDAKFGPEDPVTREQLAAILFTYAQYKEYAVAANGDLANFKDRDAASEWAENALIWAVDQKIMSGKGDGILDAKGTATRAEVAQMLVSFLNAYAE